MVICFVFFNFLFVKNGATALHFATSKGFEQVIKILVEHRSNIIDLQDKVFIFLFFLILVVF